METNAGRERKGVPAVPRRQEIESEIIRIVSSVLKTDRVSVADNFFELGGDSQLALRVWAIAGASGIGFDIADLVEAENLEAVIEIALRRAVV